MGSRSTLESAATKVFAATIILASCGGEEPNNHTEIKRSTLIVAADPPGHVFQESVQVSLSADSEPVEIFYTLNGESPFGQDAIRYDGPITIAGNVLLTFVAKEGDLFSEQVTELYELEPELVPPDRLARSLVLDDDQVVFSARRGEAGVMRRSVRLRSNGLQQVLIEGIYIDVNPDSWSFWEEGIFAVEPELEEPRYLAPGESIDLVISYTPTETLRTGIVVIRSDDQRTKDGVLTVGLTGRIWDW